MEPQQRRAVQQYYDVHTPGFLRSGHGAEAQAIHRAVWAPGVQSRNEAIEYPNACVLALARTENARRVVDLGCGVGGTLRYLATRLATEGSDGDGAVPSIQFGGLTISPVQWTTGQQLTSAIPNIALKVGDFHDATAVCSFFGAEGADLAFGIESFLHSDAPEQFFAAAGGALRTGGLLVLIDDFLTTASVQSTARTAAQSADARDRTDFARGWRTGRLRTVETTAELAAACGLQLEANTDLTPYLQLGRPRDRLFEFIAPLLRTISVDRFGFITGGVALQRLLRRGELSYNVLVMRKGGRLR